MNFLYELIARGTPVTRVLAAKATLDFPSTAAAGTQSLTISVPGAEPGDAVALARPASLTNGILFDATVTARDTVTVRCHNITAGSIDPAAALFEVVVFKLP